MAQRDRPHFSYFRKERYDEAFSARQRAADRLLALPDGNTPGTTAETPAEAFREANRALEQVRRNAAGLARSSGGTGASDTNYIFLTFVTQHLPAGLVGLVLAVIFGATMTSLSAEMSALATVTVVDIYQRHVRTDATDHQYLTASRVATVFWGVYAIVCAQFIKGMGSLIEAVNVLGSVFYGGMLGVFVLAFFFPRVTARGALYGVLVGQVIIFACWKYTGLAFLWYNVLGCVVVVLTGIALSAIDNRANAARRSTSGKAGPSYSVGPIGDTAARRADIE